MVLHENTMKTCKRQKRPRRMTASVLALATLAVNVVTGLPTQTCCFVAASRQPSSRGQQQNIHSMRSMTARASISSTSAKSGFNTLIDPLDLVKPSSRKEKRRRKEGRSSWPISVAQRLGLASVAEEDYQLRKEEWAARYTSVDSLRETFGCNKNKAWGDLDARTARRLYKTLLPRAMLELYNLGGLRPEDLAPLAYQARVAAKLYARERCNVPSRYAAMAIDGFRAWKRYGKFQPKGMSYDQVWSKYEEQIGLELLEDDQQDLTEDDVTAKVCLKILERSCKTNEHIDKWILDGKVTENKEESDLIHAIARQLELDVRLLLDPSRREPTKKGTGITARRVFTLRLVARAKKHLAKHDDITTNMHDSVPTSSHNELTVVVEPALNGEKVHTDSLRSRSGRKFQNRRKRWQERSRPDRTK